MYTHVGNTPVLRRVYTKTSKCSTVYIELRFRMSVDQFIVSLCSLEISFAVYTSVEFL